MDLDNEESVESFDEMQIIIEEADKIVFNSLPQKSKTKYMAAYEKFVKWRSTKNVTSNNMREEVMLVYLNKLSEEDKLKAPTIWSRYSMLKATLLSCDNLDIKPWSKVTSFMKKIARGYCPKKAKIFTALDITNFCANAPDNTYLVDKVILTLGLAGGLRREEIYNLRVKDIKESDDSLVISIPKTKNGSPKSFVVMGDLRAIIEKYRALRPPNVPTDNFLVNYQNGKCTRQVIGINKIGKMPQKIAAFLGKEDAKSYTGHCFRRTSATLLVDAGADITELKRHGGWKSNAVAEGYLGDSIGNKKRTFVKITDSIETEEPKTKQRSVTQVVASASSAKSSISQTASASSSENKENNPNSGKAGTTVYNINNCTVYFN